MGLIGKTVFFLLLAVFGSAPLIGSEAGWNIMYSEITEEGGGSSWRAGFHHAGDPDESSLYEVQVLYKSVFPEPLSPYYASLELGRIDLAVPGNGEAKLIIWKARIPSAEAVLNPPVRCSFVFMLSGNRARVSREYMILIRESRPPADKKADEAELLPEEAKKLLAAVTKKEAGSVRKALLYKLFHYILTSQEPLDKNGREEIGLLTLKAVIGSRSLDLPVSRSPYEKTRIRLPAGTGETITLYPVLEYRKLIPYSREIRTHREPLGDSAYLKLKQRNSSLLLRGKARKGAGEFELGPFKAEKLHLLELDAFFPYEPPGDRPAFNALLFFRNGRSEEQYLDRDGKMPLPSPSGEWSRESIQEEVLRQTALSLNPDTGEAEDLSTDALLDLYAFSSDQVKKYPALEELIDRTVAFQRRVKRFSFPSRRENLSPGKRWSLNDARDTLENPDLAPLLAEKMRRFIEPERIPLCYSKETPVMPASEENPETNAFLPHALACAALSRAASAQYEKVITDQIRHLSETTGQEEIAATDPDDLVLAGQALKLTVHRIKNNAAEKKASALLIKLKDEVFRRLKNSKSPLPLSQKIGAAQLFSPVWRPYLNTPASLLFEVPDGRMPEQGMMPSDPGSGSEGEMLEEKRELYQSAMKRAVRELRASRLSPVERRKRVKELHEEWYLYLFNIHKGGYLQPYEKMLDDELQKSLKGVK